MKILILANNDEGLYKFRKDLIKALLVKNNYVFASIPDGKWIQSIEHLGVKVIITKINRRGINPIEDMALLVKYLHIVLTIKPDLVVTYTIKPNIYGGMICRLLQVPYAENITGLGSAFQKDKFIKKIICFLYKIACKKAKVVFFENEENKQFFLNHYLIRKEQACKLNGAGVNLEEYPYTEYPDENEPIRFLFIGRVMKEKGIDELFEAGQRIKKEYSNVFFDIIGPMEDEYGSVIKKLEKDGIITYYGYQKDVRPFITRCHCFVLPSWHEGMANTLLEAGAMGRPLITSQIHGCMEAVETGVSGYLCQRQNADSLYRVIKEFILLPYEEKREMGKNARTWMEKMFDKQKVVKNTISKIQ